MYKNGNLKTFAVAINFIKKILHVYRSAKKLSQICQSILNKFQYNFYENEEESFLAKRLK